jgi:hypothetical protein
LLNQQPEFLIKDSLSNVENIKDIHQLKAVNQSKKHIQASLLPFISSYNSQKFNRELLIKTSLYLTEPQFFKII